MTTTPEAKCETCGDDPRGVTPSSGPFHALVWDSCPDCKPADVAKVRRYEYDADNEHMTPEMFGTVYVVLSTDYDTLLLERDALAAKVERLEQAGRVLVASNTRIFDEARASCESLQAELTAERERVKELEPAAECFYALCKCYRITCMGSAGLHGTKHANGYAHATFNLWTIAPGQEPTDAKDAQSLHGTDMLGRFMMVAIKNHPLTSTTKADEGEQK